MIVLFCVQYTTVCEMLADRKRVIFLYMFSLHMVPSDSSRDYDCLVRDVRTTEPAEPATSFVLNANLVAVNADANDTTITVTIALLAICKQNQDSKLCMTFATRSINCKDAVLCCQSSQIRQ